MAFKEINDFLQIDITQWQEFDQGATIEQWIPTRWALQVGDWVLWESGNQFNGMLEIVECGIPEENRVRCKIKKMD
jgi:hypothetical protein